MPPLDREILELIVYSPIILSFASIRNSRLRSRFPIFRRARIARRALLEIRRVLNFKIPTLLEFSLLKDFSNRSS